MNDHRTNEDYDLPKDHDNSQGYWNTQENQPAMAALELLTNMLALLLQGDLEVSKRSLANDLLAGSNIEACVATYTGYVVLVQHRAKIVRVGQQLVSVRPTETRAVNVQPREWDTAYRSRYDLVEDRVVVGRVRGDHVELFQDYDYMSKEISKALSGFVIELYSIDNPLSLYPPRRCQQRSAAQRISDALYDAMERDNVNISFAVIAAGVPNRALLIYRKNRSAYNPKARLEKALINGVVYPVIGIILDGEPHIADPEEDSFETLEELSGEEGFIHGEDMPVDLGLYVKRRNGADSVQLRYSMQANPEVELATKDKTTDAKRQHQKNKRAAKKRKNATPAKEATCTSGDGEEGERINSNKDTIVGRAIPSDAILNKTEPERGPDMAAVIEGIRKNVEKKL